MIQILLNGLVNGLNVGVIATAFSLVYFPTRVFHIALGGIYVLAPYLAWVALQGGLSWTLGVAVALAAGASVSVLCEVVNHWPLERKQASANAHLISSLGLFILFVQFVALIWGNQTKVLRSGIDPTFSVAGVIVTRSQAVSLVTSVLVLVVFFIWIRFTNLGLRFRGLADNATEMALRGHNVRWLRIMAFGISGMFGATAGLVVAFDIGFDPHTGLHAILLAVVATIIGGRQSLFGPAIAGATLGVVRAMVVWELSARWQEPVTFLILVVFLLFRPRGLFQPKTRLEVSK